MVSHRRQAITPAMKPVQAPLMTPASGLDKL